MRNLLRDVRYGARSLAKRPGFTLAAVFTLALGIGANTAILSTVNGFLLRPLSVPNPDRVIQLFYGSRESANVWNNFSYLNYIDLRDQNKTVEGLIAWNMTSAAISETSNKTSATEASHSEIVWGECVSGNYFDVLGVKAERGRTFLPDEDLTPNAHPVVVLGNDLWRRRFNSDSAIVGKTMFMNGHPFEIIGVAPKNFDGVKFAIRQDFWIPLMMADSVGAFGAGWRTERGWQNLTVLGRLKPGTTIRQAEADLDLIAQGLAAAYPKTNADSKIQVVPELEGRFSDIAGFLRFTGVLAVAVAGLVLLIACANVANLLLARATSRAKEIGIRLAIGASKLQIIRQLLVESLLLALMGGALGLVFAFWGCNLVHSSIPPLPYPISLDFTPDFFVLRWMLLVSSLTGFVFGLVPALIAARTDLVTVLKSDLASKIEHGVSRRLSLRNLLVVVQVSISVIVLICAGLFLRSLSKVREFDPGFKVDNLLSVRLAPGLLDYSDADGKRFFRELIARVSTRPGVRSASAALFVPLGDSNTNRGPIVKEGDPPPLPNQGISIDANVIAPGYFETMQTTLVAGRDFTEHDNDDSPQVAIVNQEFAKRMYGSDENALGKRFWERGPNSVLVEIVGVARDGRYLSLYEDKRPFIFLPAYQHDYQSEMALLISCNGPAELNAMAQTVRGEIAQLDSRIPTFGLQTGERNLAFAFWGPRIAAGLATAFGLLALFLATLGLYSVMTYNVSRRTREIGIRMALGAQASDVLRMVVGQGMSMVIIGIAIGASGAFLLTGVLTSLLFGVGSADFVTFGGVTLVLAVVALLACYIPARRAIRVKPMIALRYE